MTIITEAEVEQAALDWLKGLGWQVAHGPDIAPSTPNADRDDYGQVVLVLKPIRKGRGKGDAVYPVPLGQ